MILIFNGKWYKIVPQWKAHVYLTCIKIKNYFTVYIESVTLVCIVETIYLDGVFVGVLLVGNVPEVCSWDYVDYDLCSVVCWGWYLLRILW